MNNFFTNIQHTVTARIFSANNPNYQRQISKYLEKTTTKNQSHSNEHNILIITQHY